uniref:Uncharacterized protein n=1 Tax=Echinococcus granulosus TaxID=6210 RepID=U6JSD5_ECHGR|nr:hypothetical protein EgrG_001155600 [Echinococcus granulosus]CDS24918.1 hypothetical protein EgrG_001155700 [Echinococcus granulosus]
MGLMMSSEPRRRLFGTRDTNQAADGNLHNVLQELNKNFDSIYSLTNDSKQHRKRSMSWSLENKGNIPEFYSRPPKQKRLVPKYPETKAAPTKDSSTSPIRRKLKELNIKQSKWGANNSKCSPSPQVRKTIQILREVTNCPH